jgi:hypothetical protein
MSMGSAGVPKPWEKLLPNLGNWTCASKRTRKYNCFAFAVGDETQRWEPYGYHWPKGAKKGYALDCLVEACRTEGFELCADGSLLEDREKIAIYTNDQSGFVHAARQEPDGRWKSKLGDEEDIVHETPESLTTPSASSEVEQSDRQVDVSNPNHLEDFNSLLNAAVRKPEPKD